MRHWSAATPVVLVLLTAMAHPQQPAPRLEFEVASIKLSPPQPPGVTSTRISIDKSRLLFTNVTVKEVVEQAYQILEYQIEGPDWAGSERFDIEATIPEGAPKDSARIMLQSLLADRFQFAFHRETKEMAAYALSVAPGGPKLKPIESATGISSNSNGKITRVHAQTSLRAFENYLSLRIGRPIVDATALSGAFDFSLDWSADGVDTGDLAAPPSLFTAMGEQLGLRLQGRKLPVEIFVIDRVMPPSDN